MPPSARLLPFAMATLGVALLILMDAFMKQAALLVGAYLATLLRSAAAALLIVPVWLASRPRWPRSPVLRLHAERGVVSALMALTWFYALTILPLAEAIAISFVAPIIALYFAHRLLGETISRRARLASGLGLAGTLVIVAGQIGSGAYPRQLPLALASMACSALLYAYNFVVIRRQAQLAGAVEVASFHTGISALVLMVGAPFALGLPDLALPDAALLGMIGLAAALTVGGSLAMAWAYRRAEAQALVPLEYTGFVWAALFGWMFFHETLQPMTLVGLGLIVAGSWIARPATRSPQAP